MTIDGQSTLNLATFNFLGMIGRTDIEVRFGFNFETFEVNLTKADPKATCII